MAIATLNNAYPEISELVRGQADLLSSVSDPALYSGIWSEVKTGFDEFATDVIGLLSAAKQHFDTTIFQIADGSIVKAHEDTIKDLPFGEMAVQSLEWAVNATPSSDSITARYAPQVVGVAAGSLLIGSTLYGARKAFIGALNIAASAMKAVNVGVGTVFGKRRAEPETVFDPFTSETPRAISGDPKKELEIRDKIADRLKHMGAEGHKADGFADELVRSFASLGHKVRHLEESLGDQEKQADDAVRNTLIIAALSQRMAGLEERLKVSEDPATRAAEIRAAVLEMAAPETPQIPESPRLC